MAGTPYPKEPLYRMAFSKLTPEQIQAKLTPAAAKGPTSASPMSTEFAGQTMKVVTDKGLTLDYKFKGPNKLSVSENGAKPVDAGYGALTHDKLCLLAHLIPGTQRGFVVVIDRKTRQATVFELWFSGYKDNREVQRDVSCGYVDVAGEAAPSGRHVATNRMEGHAYHWTQDTGIQTLEFFPSAGYSHFVELTRLGGELGYCAPSDYIKIDDDFYLYARVECEFSGTLTLYAIDLNRLAQIGLRLGFDAKDNLEFYLFRGNAEWLGQIAQFEKFGDISGNPIPPPKDAKKGERRVYRPLLTMPKMTPAQVNDAVAKKTTVFPAPTGNGPQMAGNSIPSSDYLSGKSFALRYDDGLLMEYQVSGPEELQWRANGGAWTKARYKAWEPAPGVINFGHLIEGAPDHDGHMIVADFDRALFTCFNGHLNTPYFANEAGVKVRFGVIEAEGLQAPGYDRHGFTDELLGRALSWNYAPGLTSMHLYSTPHSMSWIIFTDTGAGGMEWSGPASYVKIRDQLYYMYWLEEACNGTLGTIVINLRTLHDSGIGYHCGAEGLSMSAVGAHMRHAGRFDILKFHQPQTQGTRA
jgi:hypothetical protein